MRKVIHPRTGVITTATFIDDYFGTHQYGVRVKGDIKVYRENEVKLAASQNIEEEIEAINEALNETVDESSKMEPVEQTVSEEVEAEDFPEKTSEKIISFSVLQHNNPSATQIIVLTSEGRLFACIIGMNEWGMMEPIDFSKFPKK